MSRRYGLMFLRYFLIASSFFTIAFPYVFDILIIEGAYNFFLFVAGGEVAVGWGVSCLGAGVGVCILGLGDV